MRASMSRLDLADTLRPYVPEHDNRDAASAVLNAVVERTLIVSDELKAIANTHLDTAPTSSEYVLELDAAIARVVLDWIEQWPR